MEQKLAETDHIGIIGLRNNLIEGGADPRTVEHVIVLLTSRTLTIYFFADQCRKKESDITTLTRERDEARERLAQWVSWGDRMASGHPDAPMASLDHEVRAVIANRYGMSVIVDAALTQEAP
jgi:hypothetical protein